MSSLARGLAPVLICFVTLGIDGKIAVGMHVDAAVKQPPSQTVWGCKGVTVCNLTENVESQPAFANRGSHAVGKIIKPRSEMKRRSWPEIATNDIGPVALQVSVQGHRGRSNCIPSDNVISWRSAEVLNEHLNDWGVLEIKNIGVIIENVSPQFPLGCLTRMAESENRGDPKPNRRCCEDERESRYPESEESGGVSLGLRPQLPEGFGRLIFFVGGAAFLIVLGGMLGTMRWMRLM
jgi:hypothetical protein